MSRNDQEEDRARNPRVTWDGCSVLLDINDGDRLVFARLSAASTLKIGSRNFSLQPLIGCTFGSLFRIANGSDGPYLSRAPSVTEGNNFQENDECTMKDVHKDNRKIVDNNTAQNLSGEDIDAMRRHGATGDEIIEALIANSSTFENKTLFSQEKYRLRKQKKYAPKVLLRRPFTRSICETYFKKYPARIGYLRADTLSLMLSLANVGSYSDVLVVDMVGGILTGAVAERLGGTGYVCNAYFGTMPHALDIVRMFNLSNKSMDRIVCCSSSDLLSVADEAGAEIDAHENGLSSESQPNKANIGENTLLSGNGMEGLPTLKTCKCAKAGEKAPKEAIRRWREDGFSSLMIAAPEMDSWRIFEDLLPLVAYSGPFVIYHQYLQPLAMCMHNLQTGRMAIGLQISEPWLREYQVLPSRTHPCMQMSASGGYVLSGTRICTSPPS